MEKVIDSFVMHQEDAEERFRKQEEERWKKETEIEEKRRREDRDHEMSMLRMMAQVFQRREPYYEQDHTHYNDY